MLLGLLVAIAVMLTVTVDDTRAVRGAAGLVLVAFALLSLLTGMGTLEPARLAMIGMTAAVPPGFLESSLALLAAGLAAAVTGSRSWPIGVVVVAVAGSLLPVLRVVSLPRLGGLAVLLLALLYLLAVAARAIRERLGWMRSDEAVPGATLAAVPARAHLPFLAAIAAFLSPWPWVTFATSALAFGSAMALPLRRAQRLLLGLSGLLVLGAGAVMAWGGTPTLPDPAAPSTELLDASRSILIAGLLLLPSSVALAVWPWRPLSPGLVLVPAALGLVGRYLAAAAPMGMAWWLPLVFPIVLVGVSQAFLRGHPHWALVNVSWVGLWIGTPESRLGAVLTAGAAMVLALLRPATPPGWQGAMRRIFWVAGGVGLVLVLWGGLSVQVVYTTALALVTAVGLLAWRDVAAATAKS